MGWRVETGYSGFGCPVTENRLRRMAARQGLRLVKSRRRDPRATDFGTYMLVDPDTDSLVAWGLQSGYGLTLDEVERCLTGDGDGDR